MNKFINTECIFSTIGDYPVVDQFDVSYSKLLSGSIVDNYVTGSLFTITKINNSYKTSYGERGLAFSKTGVKQKVFPSHKNDTSADSYASQTWRERAGTIRNLRIFSESERFYDTLLPSLNNLVKAVGGEIIWEANPANNPRMPLLAIYFDDWTGFQYAANLNMTFPFEPKFSMVQRSQFKKSFIATISTLDDTDYVKCDPKNSSNLIIFDYIDTNHAGESRKWQRSLSDAYVYGPSEEDIIKIIFGIGDKSKNKLNRRLYYSGQLTAVGPIIRGWKYGLFSGFPVYSSVLFRRDRFGQFRDMLEQRQYTAVTVDYLNAPGVKFNEFEGTPIPISNSLSNKINTIQEHPVEVRFVKQTLLNGKLSYVKNDSINTDSSNLSQFVTSSLPYFDGESKNRGPLPPSVNANTAVLTMKPDSFGNITI